MSSQTKLHVFIIFWFFSALCATPSSKLRSKRQVGRDLQWATTFQIQLYALQTSTKALRHQLLKNWVINGSNTLMKLPKRAFRNDAGFCRGGSNSSLGTGHLQVAQHEIPSKKSGWFRDTRLTIAGHAESFIHLSEKQLNLYHTLLNSRELNTCVVFKIRNIRATRSCSHRA